MITLGRGKKIREDFDNLIGDALRRAERGDVDETVALIKRAWHLSNQHGLNFG